MPEPKMPKREVTIPNERTIMLAHQAKQHLEECMSILERIEADNPTVDDFVDIRFAQRKLHSGIGILRDFIDLPNTGKR